jgi:hypothetical protein
MEAYKHAKAVGAIGDGIRILRANLEPLPRLAAENQGTVSDDGVITTDDCSADGLLDFGQTFAAACGARFFARAVDMVPA